MTPVFILSEGFLANGSEPWPVPRVDELPRIEQLREVYRKDPRAACEELDFYRRSISKAVGFE